MNFELSDASTTGHNTVLSLDTLTMDEQQSMAILLLCRHKFGTAITVPDPVITDFTYTPFDDSSFTDPYTDGDTINTEFIPLNLIIHSLVVCAFNWIL